MGDIGEVAVVDGAAAYRKLRFFVESWVSVHPITGKKRQCGEKDGTLEWG
jgi:hypothetical protein